MSYKTTIHDEIKTIEFARLSGANYVLLNVNDLQKDKLFGAGYYYICIKDGLSAFTWIKDEKEWRELRKQLRGNDKEVLLKQ
jgi:hypothetical protein